MPSPPRAGGLHARSVTQGPAHALHTRDPRVSSTQPCPAPASPPAPSHSSNSDSNPKPSVPSPDSCPVNPPGGAGAFRVAPAGTFPGGPVVKNQGAWVQFLVGEPRSHMPQGNEVCQPWVLNHTLGSLHTSVKTLNSHTHTHTHTQNPAPADANQRRRSATVVSTGMQKRGPTLKQPPSPGIPGASAPHSRCRAPCWGHLACRPLTLTAALWGHNSKHPSKWLRSPHSQRPRGVGQGQAG